MSTQTRTDPSRSQRDELERLQQELRETRRQREALPRENAELAAQVETLEREVRWLRRTVEVAREEAERPASSLPDQLIPPFRAAPSRRTAYGRTRYALRLVLPMLLSFMYVAGTIIGSAWRMTLAGGLLLLCVVLAYVLQGPEDDEEGPGWNFDEEGFAPVGKGTTHGKVCYREIQKVEVGQGWLQRFFDFGSVRVIWTPGAPTSIGEALSYPNRAITLDMLDDPERLSEWLRDQARAAKEKKRVD